MNPLLEHYRVDLESPDVSGAEHLEMLDIRDQLADMADQLTEQERQVLHDADQRLIQQAQAFNAELSRFANLADHRRRHDVPAERWWWYLDVLSRLPRDNPSAA